MAENKVLWVFPRSYGNALVASLIVTTIVALIWSYVEAQSFSTDHAWVILIEMILLAAIIGWVVGLAIGDSRPSTLWVAAGFAVLGTVMTHGLMAGGAAGAGVDDSLLGTLFVDAFSTTVSVGYTVLAIIAAAFATWGGRAKVIVPARSE